MREVRGQRQRWRHWVAGSEGGGRGLSTGAGKGRNGLCLGDLTVAWEASDPEVTLATAQQEHDTPSLAGSTTAQH